MKLSDVKEVYEIVEKYLFLPEWTTRQHVEDFILWLLDDKELREEGWNQASRQPFPYCLHELYLEYATEQGYIEEEIGQNEPLMFIDDNKYLNDWYYRNVL